MPHRWMPVGITGLVLFATPLAAQTTLPPISLGAGLRTSFVHASPDGVDDTDKFLVDSVRLYVSGPVTDKIKFMVNTEYTGSTNDIGVLDAVARFELSPKFNIWMGRHLPPSDRANLYGPYYAHHWGVYTDGIQNGHPFIFQGRDNGVTYWGDFGKAKVSAGVYDGESATGDTELLTAARVQFDFWDKENGYYLNGTYYGAKEPARGRRCHPGAGRRHRNDHRLPAREEGHRRWSRHRRKRIRQLRPARRIRRPVRRERRRLRAGRVSLSEHRGHRQVRGPRQVRQSDLP